MLISFGLNFDQQLHNKNNSIEMVEKTSLASLFVSLAYIELHGDLVHFLFSTQSLMGHTTESPLFRAVLSFDMLVSLLVVGIQHFVKFLEFSFFFILVVHHYCCCLLLVPMSFWSKMSFTLSS